MFKQKLVELKEMVNLVLIIICDDSIVEHIMNGDTSVKSVTTARRERIMWLAIFTLDTPTSPSTWGSPLYPLSAMAR